MVYQDERRVSWLLPVLWSRGADKEAYGDTADAKHCERRLDMAEAMEMGLARELVTDFVRPLRRSRDLWKFHVERSDDRQQFRLLCNDGQFLMCAKASRESRQVDFFLYDPESREQVAHDADRPAFTMSCSSSRAEWSLVRERCDCCHYTPWHLSCACREKPEVACIRHASHPVGDGINKCMDIELLEDTSHLDCSECGMRIHNLVTRLPAWNHDLNSLVLDFVGRRVLPSAGNFQLVAEGAPEHVVCQCAKIGPDTFGLDFMYPLTVAQAFGAAVTAFLRTE